MATPITYGSFNLNDNVNYFVINKSLSAPAIVPTMYKIGRLEGMKKTGETINERQIPIQVRILGTSRTDLESKVDTMQKALNFRNQQFSLRANDSRYFMADCIKCEVDLSPGKVISTIANLLFFCYQPYPFAASASTQDSGTVAMTFSSGQIYTYSNSVTGGGTVFNRPSIRIYQRTAACSTTLTTGLTNNNVYTTLSVASLPVGLTTRDTLTIGTGPSQNVTVSANASPGATSVSVTSFTANNTYASSTAVNRNVAMTNIQVAQTTDSTHLYITIGLPVVTGDYIDINCDPTNNATGWTAILNSSGFLSTLNGVFPVIEPTSTNFTYTITCNSNPSIQVVYTYTPRWLS